MVTPHLKAIGDPTFKEPQGISNPFRDIGRVFILLFKAKQRQINCPKNRRQYKKIDPIFSIVNETKTEVAETVHCMNETKKTFRLVAKRCVVRKGNYLSTGGRIVIMP